MIFLWFTIIFKDSAKIKRKKKAKTTFKTIYNEESEVNAQFQKVKGGGLLDFEV